MATPVFTLPTSGSDPKKATKEGLEGNINQIIQYLDDMRIRGDAAQTTGLNFQGPWDASTELFPSVNLDGGPLERGDFFWVSVEGTFGGETYLVNEPIVAVVGNPSTSDVDDWYHAPVDPSLLPLIERLDTYPVTFDTVANFFAATLADIKRVANATTGTAYVVVKDGGYRYSVDLSQADSFDITTDAGVEFTGIPTADGVLSVAAYNPANDGVTDDSTKLQAVLSSGYNVAMQRGGTYYASGLELSLNGIEVHGNEAKIVNVAGVTDDVFLVSGEDNTIYDLDVDGNGSTTDGSVIANSYTGLNLQGAGNKAVRCKGLNVGEYLTSGDMGAATQVGNGIGAVSTDAARPNILESCITYDNKNYGMNFRENVVVLGGSTYDNGTNGVGNRYASNVKIYDLDIGAQKSDNPDTITNGLYFDTETSGANVDKNSRGLLLSGVTIAAQEGRSVTMTRWTDVTFDSCEIQGSVLIQSTIPSDAVDIGTTGYIKLIDTQIAGTALIQGHQRVISRETEYLSTASEGLKIFNVEDEVTIKGGNTDASLAVINLCGKTLIEDFAVTGRMVISSGTSTAKVSRCDFTKVTKVQDVPGLNVGSNTDVIGNHFENQAIAVYSSGGVNNNIANNGFDDCGMADNVLQNAVIVLLGAGTSGAVVSGNILDGSTGRSVYAPTFNKGVLANNIIKGGTGTLSVGGTGYTAVGNNMSDTATWSLTGTAVVNTNYVSGDVTVAGTYPPVAV